MDFWTRAALEGLDVTANVLDPFSVKAEFGAEFEGPAPIRLMMNRVVPFLAAVGPERGSEQYVRLAAEPPLINVSGAYFVKGRVRGRAISILLIRFRLGRGCGRAATQESRGPRLGHVVDPLLYARVERQRRTALRIRTLGDRVRSVQRVAGLPWPPRTEHQSRSLSINRSSEEPPQVASRRHEPGRPKRDSCCHEPPPRGGAASRDLAAASGPRAPEGEAARRWLRGRPANSLLHRARRLQLDLRGSGRAASGTP